MPAMVIRFTIGTYTRQIFGSAVLRNIRRTNLFTCSLSPAVHDFNINDHKPDTNKKPDDDPGNCLSFHDLCPPEKFLGFAELGQASLSSIGDVDPSALLDPVPILDSLHHDSSVERLPVSKHQQSLDVCRSDSRVVTNGGQDVFQVLMILCHSIIVLECKVEIAPKRKLPSLAWRCIVSGGHHEARKQTNLLFRAAYSFQPGRHQEPRTGDVLDL